MKLLRLDRAAGLIDPVTRRSPFIDPETKQVVEIADVPDVVHWHRRILDGDIARINESVQPVGDEPIKPLTTR